MRALVGNGRLAVGCRDTLHGYVANFGVELIAKRTSFSESVRGERFRGTQGEGLRGPLICGPAWARRLRQTLVFPQRAFRRRTFPGRSTSSTRDAIDSRKQLARIRAIVRPPPALPRFRTDRQRTSYATCADLRVLRAID